MHLKHLSLTNFRNFARLDLSLPPRMVLILGGNAQGKTSILEAVYFLASFASFQTHTDRQLVNFVEARSALAVTRLVGDYQRNGVKHRMEVRLVLEPTGTNGQRLRKEILLDGVKKQANDVIGHFNAVIFIPQMSQIIEGGPEERRRYLNMALVAGRAQLRRRAVRIHPGAGAAQCPAQGPRRERRGCALNWRSGMKHSRAWAPGSCPGASQPFNRSSAWRRAFTMSSPTAARSCACTTSRPTIRCRRPPVRFGLKLTTEVDRSAISTEEIQSGFLARLAALRSEEIARGMTVIGPHRDELRFLGNGIDLGEYGSRGQMRTTLLALKLAEVAWMKERTGEWPVTLLDEVMAELDLERRHDLLRYVAGRRAGHAHRHRCRHVRR